VLPPLRDRLEDLEALIQRFILHANRVNGRQVRSVEPAALARLHAYDWPGNVRELRNVIDRAVVVAEDDEIHLEDLPQRLRSEPPGNEPGGSLPDGEHTVTAGEEPSKNVVLTAAEQRKRLTEMEREMLLAAVRVSGGNKTEAARRIGMPLRTLVRKLSGLRSRGRP
jgi:DNA-binding NtrC family response regulator